MQVHESLVELIGNTPLVRLRKVTRHLGAGHGASSAPAVLAKVEYVNPGGSVKDRIALRMVEAAEQSGALKPGGTIVEPTSGNTGVGLAIVAAEKGYKCVFVCPDKVRARQDRHARAPTAPRWSCARPRCRRTRLTPTTASLTGWPPRCPAAGSPTSTPTRRTPRRTTTPPGPEIWAPDRRQDHALRGRHRHRRHDLRHRPVPQGGVGGRGQGDRRRPGGLGLLRRHRAALPGRGRRRGYLARHLRPDICDEIIAVERRRLVPDDPAAGPRGGAAGRRLLRDGRGRRTRGRRAGRTRRRRSWCCCPTAGAATCRRSSTTTGWPTTASLPRRPPSRGSPTCSSARRGRAAVRACPPGRDSQGGDRDAARVRRVPAAGASRRSRR